MLLFYSVRNLLPSLTWYCTFIFRSHRHLRFLHNFSISTRLLCSKLLEMLYATRTFMHFSAICYMRSLSIYASMTVHSTFSSQWSWNFDGQCRFFSPFSPTSTTHFAFWSFSKTALFNSYLCMCICLRVFVFHFAVATSELWKLVCWNFLRVMKSKINFITMHQTCSY